MAPKLVIGVKKYDRATAVLNRVHSCPSRKEWIIKMLSMIYKRVVEQSALNNLRKKCHAFSQNGDLRSNSMIHVSRFQPLKEKL